MPLIHVNGRDYDLVSVNDLTLDEAIVLYDWSKLTLDQIPDLEGFHPGLIAGLIHISVARGEPGEPGAQIKRAVGKIPVAELERVFGDISEEVEETGNPPTANEPSSPPSATGGTSAPTGEPAPAPNQVNGSGSPGSDTGATSDLAISVP
jgi:hypothetical protein